MVVHQCDLCKEIIQSFTTYTLPVNNYAYIENRGTKIQKIKISIEPKKVDLCPKCQMLLANFLDPYLNK